MSNERKIKLLHICPDLLNLYGDYANLLVLSRALSDMGAEAEIVKVAYGEKPELSGAALLYIGPGTEKRLGWAGEWLAGYREEFKAAAEDGLPMMFWGSAAELACAELREEDKALPGQERTAEMLGIFDACALRTKTRQVGDILYKSELSENLLAGYINKSGFIRSEEKPLFTAVFGPGGMTDEQGKELPCEGLYKNNVIASYATGPALARNPWLKKLIAARVFARALPNETPGEIKEDYSDIGYKITVTELKKRMGT